MKVGGEYMYQNIFMDFGHTRYGMIDATGGPIPANVQDLFRVWNDWSICNLAALSPITRRYQVSFVARRIYDPRQVFSGFVQNDLKLTSALTLNLGVRYDVNVSAPSPSGCPRIRRSVSSRISRATTTTSRLGWGLCTRCRVGPHCRAGRLRQVLRRNARHRHAFQHDDDADADS
jgi:outer membrane receptor protein involved in Fe transport